MRATKPNEAQDIGVQRAQVAFHRYAAFGEQAIAMERYESRNAWRKGLIERHRDFVREMSPFAEVGANAGYTSYLLASDFGARGFALDISEDALRQGVMLRERWPSPNPPILAAADASSLPFQTGSLALVLSFQLLSQFQQIEPVIAEIHRVLAPGGVYFFGDEPVRRRLTAGLFRSPYPEFMSGWQRRLHTAGLLDFLAADVIGAAQEEKVGIRQNHRMRMADWRQLLSRHFAYLRFEIALREEGRLNGVLRDAARKLGGHNWRESAADLLGGTLSGFCRKAGVLDARIPEPLARLMGCPDCGSALAASASELRCGGCGYFAPSRDGVFNCLPSKNRERLYPSEQGEAVDCNAPGHEQGILSGFHELDGSGGNRFRWIGEKARVRLQRTWSGPAILSLSGFVHPGNCPVTIEIRVNGVPLKAERVREAGVFLIEREAPESSGYEVEIGATPVWRPAGEDRDFTIVLNAIRISGR